MAIGGVYLAAYSARARSLARHRRPIAHARRLAFVTGVCLVVAVQLPPLDNLADEVLVAHMAQHLLIGDIASLLVVVGLSGPMLSPLLRLRWTRWMRPLALPLPALGIWALDTYVWRLPVLYQAALRHDLLHALEHASYLWSGMLLWTALLGPLPKPRWFGNWARLGYVAVVRLAGAALANAFIWSGTVFYPYYRHRDASVGLATLSDQNVAGAVMMIEQLLLTICLLAWLFSKFAAQDEERQALLDIANTRGVELAEERAARAAASGRSEQLRKRLLDGEGRSAS